MCLPRPTPDEAFLGNVSPVRSGGAFGVQPRGFVGVVGCYKQYDKVGRGIPSDPAICACFHPASCYRVCYFGGPAMIGSPWP